MNHMLVLFVDLYYTMPKTIMNKINKYKCLNWATAFTKAMPV